MCLWSLGAAHVVMLVFSRRSLVLIICWYDSELFDRNTQDAYFNPNNATINGTALGKSGIGFIIFLFRHKNVCCGYSLEAPWWGTSNEYLQEMFS